MAHSSSPRLTRRHALLTGISIAAVLLSSAPSALAGPADEANRILKRLEIRPDLLWTCVAELAALGDEAVPALTEKLGGETPATQQLAAAAALIQLDEPDAALDPLLALLPALTDTAEFEAALGLLVEAGDESTGEDIEAEMDLIDVTDPVRVLAVSRTVYLLSQSEAALERVRGLLNHARPSVVRRAVLAYSDMGFASEVKASLERFADEPTLIGRQARVHLSKLSIRASIATVRETGKSKLKPNFLPEVTGIAKMHFVDGKRVTKGDPDPKRPRDPVIEPVVDLAGEGMVEGLDPFCVYLKFPDFDREQTDIGGRYGGIGATVTKRPTDDYIKINQPIYDEPAPAYRAGMRSGDWLVSADGVDLKGKEIDEVVDLLKGEPNTSVMVGFMREGWTEPKVVPITRALIEVNTAKWEMLPGDIGYIRLERFGYRSHHDMRKALDELDKRGAKGLVLDLRGNPGGSLETVLNIADMFLSEGTMIAYVKGVAAEWRAKKVYKAKADHDRSWQPPTVVLINGESASGSEMLSGALKEANRADIVGERTFGKGIGQSFYNLFASEPAPDKPKFTNRILRVTVFEYFLDNDKRVQEVGVHPHFKVKPARMESWEAFAVLALRETGNLDGYVRKHYAANHDLMVQLASYDAQDTSRYPGFDDWYAGLNTKLSKQRVRSELQARIRKNVADERAKEFLFDFETDRQLQKGLLVLGAKMSLDIRKIPEFASFPAALDEIKKDTAK